MKGIPDKVSADVAALNPQLFASRYITAPPAALVRETKEERGREKRLQTLCENHLSHLGFRRMTADDAGKSDVGYFGHLHNARCNPLLPDLFIINADGSRCLLVELKVEDRYQPGQLEMINCGAWIECRTFNDFAAVASSFINADRGGQNDTQPRIVDET